MTSKKKNTSSKILSSSEQNKGIFTRLRVKITGMITFVVLTILVIVFSVVVIDDYNTRMGSVYNVLSSSITEEVSKHTQMILQHPYDDPFKNITDTEMERFMEDSTIYDSYNLEAEEYNLEENAKKQNENVTTLGIDSNFTYESNVPILMYIVDYKKTELVPIINNSATLSDETRERSLDKFVHAETGFQRDSDSKLCFLKKSTKLGDVIAFTDVSIVDSYMERVIKSYLIVILAVVASLGVASWIFSGWIVAPITEAWNRQRRFVADASHELKTPVSVVMATANVVMDDPDIDSESKKWAKTVYEESSNMKTLIEDMLYLAATDKSADSAQETFDLGYAAMKAAMQFEARAFEKGNELEYDDVERGAFVKADKKGMERVLAILLDNACKYSHKDTVITVSMEKTKKQLIINVSDEGEEIPEGKEEEIFERFFRADEARTGANGYGLGLSMAKDIVENNGGEISAKSKDGITAFTLKMPLVAAPVEEKLG